jgi:hypothetical protein
MENKKRHHELSAKIFKMGDALMKEGVDKEDYIITNVGNFMILISGIIHDENDINLFGELCSMFSAKKLYETQRLENPMADMLDEDIYKIIDKLRNEMNEDFEMGEDDDDDDE